MARRVAAEALVDLRRRLDQLAPRDAERGRLTAAAAELYGVSRASGRPPIPSCSDRADDPGLPPDVLTGILAPFCQPNHVAQLHVVKHALPQRRDRLGHRKPPVERIAETRRS